MPHSYFLSALAAYFGGKRSLLPWIMRHLIQVVPRSEWPKLSFIDLFMGGGSVSLMAKALGFQCIHSNDWALRAQVIGAALLRNDHIRLTRQDLLFINQALPEGHPTGLAETFYSPSVFSKRHAQALDRWLYWTSQIQDETKQALCKLLIWHCIYQFICIPTSVNTSNRPFAEALDGLRGWDTLNPKRFQDKSLDSLLKPTFQCLSEKMPVVNKGVFGGSPGSMYQQDAITLLQQVEGDILYDDPPYAQTMRYEKAFTVIDHLLTEQTIEQASAFSQSTQSLDDLFDHAQHIPTWVLSYGNKTMDLAGLIELVQRHAGTRKVIGFAKRYQHMPHVSKIPSIKSYSLLQAQKERAFPMLVEIALSNLQADPRNANYGMLETQAKILKHIQRTGHCPYLIVRPHPTEPGMYIIIDGHHRLLILKQLGWSSVGCQVWEIGEKEAGLSLATLNRLRGTDDFRKRSELIDTLAQSLGREELSSLIPESTSEIQDMLALLRLDEEALEREIQAQREAE